MSIPFLLKIFSKWNNSAFETSFMGKLRVWGYYEIGILIALIFTLIGFGYLALEVKKITLSGKTLGCSLLNILITFLFVVFIIENGNRSFLNIINYLSIGMIVIWLVIEIATASWIIKKLRKSKT